jgi:phage terminase large subunit GpA-like protein
MRTLTAVIDTSAQRAESAIWLYGRTGNVTFCG